MGVSSPHRYCRNPAPLGFIGRRVLFQALIGTVETALRGPKVSAFFEFQALIGTVETVGERGVGSTKVGVSSPHRYCRNIIAPTSSLPLQGRFKPS